MGIFNTLTGAIFGNQSNYHPQQYNIDESAYTDPNLQANLNAYNSALAARMGQGVPQSGTGPAYLYGAPSGSPQGSPQSSMGGYTNTTSASSSAPKGVLGNFMAGVKNAAANDTMPTDPLGKELYAAKGRTGNTSGNSANTNTVSPVAAGSGSSSGGTTQQQQQGSGSSGSNGQPFGTAAGVSPATGNADSQGAFLNQLYLRATGQQKGLGTQLANQATDQAVALAKAETAGTRGNIGMAQRNALQAAQTAKLQGNQQAVNTAIAEQEAAQNAGGALATSARGQDIDTAQLAQQNQQFNAGQIQNNAQFNADLQQKAQNEIDAMTQYYTSLGYSEEQAAYQAARDYQALQVQQVVGINQMNMNQSVSNAGNMNNIMTAGLQVAGGPKNPPVG